MVHHTLKHIHVASTNICGEGWGHLLAPWCTKAGQHCYRETPQWKWACWIILHTLDHVYLSTVTHCKNKLIVLTAEWLPWLKPSWGGSGCERFTYRHKATRSLTTLIHHQPDPVHLTRYTDNPENILWGGHTNAHFKVLVRDFHACSYYNHNHIISELPAWIIIDQPYAISLYYQSL